MADSKITALTSIGTSTDPANDPLVIVDVSDTSMAASGTTKKVSLNNLLACSPTATLASATITGDLTVRTNQLVVNSSGSFVGKSVGGVGVDGVQLLAGGFSGFSASATTALFVNRNTSDGTVLQLGRSGASAADLGAIAGGGLTVGLSGSEWMRVNSTGLGVGVAPVARIDLLVADAAEATRFRAASGWLRIHPYLNATDNCRLQAVNGTNSALIPISVEGLTVRLNSNFGNAVTIDNLGNTISNVNSAIPSLGTNSQMVFNLTSNTNLRISVRGTDGTTRVANITLA